MQERIFVVRELRVWNACFCVKVMRWLDMQVGVSISGFVENWCIELAIFDVDFDVQEFDWDRRDIVSEFDWRVEVSDKIDEI